MGRAAAQVLVVAVLMARVTVVAVLILISRVTQAIKAVRVVIINSPDRGLNSSNSLVIKVIRSSSIVDSIMCSPPVYVNETRRFIKGR